MSSSSNYTRAEHEYVVEANIKEMIVPEALCYETDTVFILLSERELREKDMLRNPVIFY